MCMLKICPRYVNLSLNPAGGGPVRYARVILQGHETIRNQFDIPEIPEPNQPTGAQLVRDHKPPQLEYLWLSDMSGFSTSAAEVPQLMILVLVYEQFCCRQLKDTLPDHGGLPGSCSQPLGNSGGRPRGHLLKFSVVSYLWAKAHPKEY